LELAEPTFSFAPLREEDLGLIRTWLLRTHVRRWYDDVAT